MAERRNSFPRRLIGRGRSILRKIMTRRSVLFILVFSLVIGGTFYFIPRNNFDWKTELEKPDIVLDPPEDTSLKQWGVPN
jgi:hypothetical protein